MIENQHSLISFNYHLKFVLFMSNFCKLIHFVNASSTIFPLNSVFKAIAVSGQRIFNKYIQSGSNTFLHNGDYINYNQRPERIYIRGPLHDDIELQVMQFLFLVAHYFCEISKLPHF